MFAIARWTWIPLVVALLSGCDSHEGQDAPVPGEIEALERGMWDDYGNGHYDVMLERMLPDAVILGPEGIRDRTGAIEAMARASCRVDDYSFEDVRVTVLAPTVAMITYRSRLTGRCGGEAWASADVHSSAWVKRDGRWMTAVHHENPVSP